MADLFGMNLSAPPGVVLPSLPGVPTLEGDLLWLLEGVFLSEVLSLFSPLLLPRPTRPGDFCREPPLENIFRKNYGIWSRGFWDILPLLRVYN